MKIKLIELESLVHKAITNYGYSESEAAVIQNILLYAQLRGNNQGVVKLIGRGIPRRPEGQEPTIEKETPVSALVNGNATHAMVVMDRLVDIALEKAGKVGIGIAGNYNTDESTGALGYYVNRIAEKGMIGIAFASAPFQTTAPHGSSEARFCTNPMAYGFPTQNDPIVLDMSTSAMAYYGLIEAKTAGKTVPAGIGYDSNGNETTDPAEIMSGALKTFGGHKGSGLALVVQILAGAFVKADSFDNDSSNAGNLVIAIDPNIFLDADDFKKRVSEIVSKVKNARKLEGVTEIFVPGEQGSKVREAAISTGEIEIEDNLYNSLKLVVG
jgi:L-2-hydroxycarboxylate dehydrogenase (NAD+)